MGTKPTTLALLISATLCATSLNAVAAPTSTILASATSTADVAMDETIVVIGRNHTNPLNIAANVNVIDAADIEMSGATNLTDLLRGQSGIQVSDNNSGAVFSMRGFSSSQAVNNTLILVDGRRLNNIDISAPSVESIPLNLIERVEILSGSAGVLYGDQAVGGVINVITKAPTETSGGLQVGGGSFDTYEVKGDVSGAITDTWRYFLAGSYNQGDNYRDNNDNETGSILGRIQYQTDVEDFYVEVNHFDNDRQAPGALSLTQYEQNPRQVASFSEGEYSHEITTALRSGYQYQLTDVWALAADLTYSDSATSSFLFGSAGHIDRELLSFSPKATANYQLANGTLTMVAGIDVSRGEADFDTLYIQRNNQQTMQSAYVQASVPLTSTLSYVVGGRYSEVTDDLTDQLLYAQGIELDNDAHALELGLNYRPSAEHRLYVRANDNFRFAKVDEQAYTPLDVQGLNPQTGRSYEAGWDWVGATQTVTLNLYRLDLEDEIVYDGSRTDGPYGGGANVNADESRRVGLNTRYEVQLSNDWLLGASYDYIDAEFTQGENDGKALSWVAEHSGKAYMSYDFAQHWQTFVEAVYTGERYMEGDNSNAGDKLDSYVLTNVALNYRHNAWTASLRVDNLLDEDYVGTGYYSSYGNGYYSGTGRSFRITAGYRF
ncbi:TonB-dependent receptor [Shewanella sp.]|uniref:TonB-dependent receptor n=4 Tax=Shewanella sp. TaxID=50422 RepID=UPI0040489B87